MFDRFRLGALVAAMFVLPFTGCNISNGLDSIQVTPSTNTMVALGPQCS